MNMFCSYHISVRRAFIGDSNPRHTPPGSSTVKVDGTIRKSVSEFLVESVKKNDVGRTVSEI